MFGEHDNYHRAMMPSLSGVPDDIPAVTMAGILYLYSNMTL